MATPGPLMTPGGSGPVSNIPENLNQSSSSIQSNIPTQLIIWGMVGFILVELIAVLCLIRYCCRARYVKKRKFKEREIILSDQTDLYYTDHHKSMNNTSHYSDVKHHTDDNIMVDDVRSVRSVHSTIHTVPKPKLSTFELHLNIDKPRQEECKTLRYSTTASKTLDERKYNYNGSLKRPAFEIISHADQRPATPVKYETVKEFSLDSPNRNIRKKYDRSRTQPIGKINFAYENSFKNSGEKVEWQTADEIRTVDWDGLKKMTSSYSEKEWPSREKDFVYSSFNDSYLNAYERLLMSNIRSKTGFLDQKLAQTKRPDYKKFDELNITESDYVKRVIKDPETDEILAVKTESLVKDKSNISVIDVRYDDKIEEFNIPKLPPPLQFQQSATRSSVETKDTKTRIGSINKKHESEDFLSSHEINIQPDAISISTNNQLDSPEEVNDYIKKLDKFETRTDKYNFSELNKNFLEEIETFNSVNLKHIRQESNVSVKKEISTPVPPKPPSFTGHSPVIIRKKVTDEDRQSIASSMKKGSAHLY